MKLLADLSLLSSPYTWMTPPGRAPSPDVGDVLLAGDRVGSRGAEPTEGAHGIPSRKGWRVGEHMPFWGHGKGQGQPQPLSCHGLGDFF